MSVLRITVIAGDVRIACGNCGIRRIGEVRSEQSAIRDVQEEKESERGLMHLEWNVSFVEAFGAKATERSRREKRCCFLEAGCN